MIGEVDDASSLIGDLLEGRLGEVEVETGGAARVATWTEVGEGDHDGRVEAVAAVHARDPAAGGRWPRGATG